MVFVRTKKIKATSCLLWKCYWVLNRQNTFKSIWHTNGLASSRTQSCNKHTRWIPLQKNLFVHFSTSTDSYCESIIKGLDIKKLLDHVPSSYLGSSGEVNICCKITFFFVQDSIFRFQATWQEWANRTIRTCFMNVWISRI